VARMDAGVMQCEACWRKIILVYIWSRKPEQGARMRHIDHALCPLHEPSKKQRSRTKDNVESHEDLPVDGDDDGLESEIHFNRMNHK
jgi:hypothetical protein